MVHISFPSCCKMRTVSQEVAHAFWALSYATNDFNTHLAGWNRNSAAYKLWSRAKTCINPCQHEPADTKSGNT